MARLIAKSIVAAGYSKIREIEKGRDPNGE